MKKIRLILSVLLCICLLICAASAYGEDERRLPDEEELNTKVTEILSKLNLNGKSDYDKIYGVYNYICQAVLYDFEATGQDGWDGESLGYGQTAYEALCEGKSVCAGIANAVSLLLSKLEIPCKVMTGTNNGVGHAWNLVKLEGKWYYLDATSDLGRSEFQGFLKGWGDMEDYTLSEESNEEIKDEDVQETSLEEETKPTYETAGDFLINPGDGEVTIYSYTGTDTNVVIPAQINNRAVKRLSQYFINGNDTMETLTISEGVQEVSSLFIGHCPALKSISFPSTIRYTALSGGIFNSGLGLIETCNSLQTVTVAEGNPWLCVVDNVLYDRDKTTILLYPAQNPAETVHVPEGVTTIGNDTFENNPFLKEVVLPNTVQSIGYWAFNGCSALEKVNFPEGCTFIGQYAFNGTKLDEIHLPASMETIVTPAFTPSVNTITVSEENPYYYAEDNVLFTRNGVLVLYAAKKENSSYTIPSGTAFIDEYAFYGANNLTQLVIPEGVKILLNGAIWQCRNLREIELPGTVERLDDLVFADCDHLGKLVIPASVTEFGNYVLANVTGTIIWGQAGSAAQQWAEANGYAFYDMSQEGFFAGTCGENATWTLSKDGILRIDGSGKIQDGAHWEKYSKAIREVIVSEGITSIGEYAFSGLDTESVTLPESLQTIGKNAFAGSWQLKECVIPRGVTAIDNFAFYCCKALNSVTIENPDMEFSGDIFDVSPQVTIHGWPGSTAEVFANGYGIGFAALECSQHELIPHEKVAATLTATGMEAYWECSVCGKLFSDEAGTTEIETPVEILRKGWIEDNGKWYYFPESGEMFHGGWLEIDSAYYCFDENGLMRTGWYEENGSKYYLGTDGKMATGDVTIDGITYHFAENGIYEEPEETTEQEEPEETEETTDPENPAEQGDPRWSNTDAGWTYINDDGTKATGWLQSGNDWYYLNANGIMQTGWVSDGENWYFMKPSGTMATGWISDGGTWFYMDSSGAMATGWIWDSGSWYYMKSSGTMATGWLYDDGNWYYMQSSGVMATGWVYDSGSWYYFDAGGTMVTGWKYAGSKWYYFRNSGAMVTGWFEDKEAENKLPVNQRKPLWYWFDDNGQMATGWKEIDGQWEMFDDSGVWLYTWDGK